MFLYTRALFMLHSKAAIMNLQFTQQVFHFQTHFQTEFSVTNSN